MCVHALQEEEYKESHQEAGVVSDAKKIKMVEHEVDTIFDELHLSHEQVRAIGLGLGLGLGPGRFWPGLGRG